MTKKQSNSDNLKKILTGYKKVNNTLKGKKQEFLGLNREFDYYQEDILKEYKRDNDIKHPRDNGDLKEYDITTFLQNSGFIPFKFGISGSKVRVASSEGYLSQEMDVVFYDKLNNFYLMNRKGQYAVYPVETVYGVMQIKSKLTKQELKSAFSNIESYKKLNKQDNNQYGIKIINSQTSDRGFGIIFAYDTNLKFKDIVKEYENYYKEKSNKIRCNCIIILNKGIILPGDEQGYRCFNNYIETITNITATGREDLSQDCLYQFYSILVELLNNTSVQIPNISKYYKLPLISGEYSYSFVNGDSSELFICPKHGPYEKKIIGDKLNDIMQYCTTIKPINWLKAIDIAYGNPLDTEKYLKQNHLVYIYNPNNLEYKNIIVKETEFNGKMTLSLAYDEIICDGKYIWIPEYYQKNIFESCPKCIKKLKKSK